MGIIKYILIILVGIPIIFLLVYGMTWILRTVILALPPVLSVILILLLMVMGAIAKGKNGFL
jgi:hypothetical protein